MVMELPRFFALESVDASKYLRHVKGGGKDHPTDMECIGEEVVSPYTKFEAEMPSKMDNSDKGLVHIRCCYNNKYWIKDNEKSDLITPRAGMPEEDKTKWSCTLFQPFFNMHGTSLQVRFKHVQLDQPLSVHVAGQNCIKVSQSVEASYFNVVNWESLMVLPKHVAFKRHDGKYLNVLIDDEDLVFTSDDAGDPTVGQEVVTTRDGSIRLKSDCLNKYWYQSPNSWIWPQCDSKNLFQPIRVGGNIVALRSLSNNKFCRSYKDGDRDYLRADVSTISCDARLEVEELVLFRTIYNVQFRETDGRIYDETEITMASGEVVNRTNVEDTIELKLSYEDTRTSSWHFSASLTLGSKFTMESGIPVIFEGEIEVSASITLGLEYTTTTSTTRLAESVYRVNVPARTSVKVSLKATKGKCDVPYSYTQCDTLYNGETETYKKDDGVFTGTNAYYLRYETVEKSL